MAFGASVSLGERGSKSSTHEAGAPVCARGLCKQIDGRVVLRDVSFELARGCFAVVMGANGAGKSTLLRLVSTLTGATSGELQLFGERVGARSAGLRARIGVIAHETMLYRDLTALENVVLFARMHGIRNAMARAQAVLELLGVSDRANDAVKSLSRGTAQRVAIARALVHQPELVLADEPFTGLDVASRELVEHVFTELWGGGCTMLMSGHDVEQSLRLSERVLVLERGSIGLDAPSHRLSAGELAGRIGGRR